MAISKFSDIYKQELNSKGVLSSLGSAALKQTRERMDIRNVLFGGTGAISKTWQKIFGAGYSGMRGNAANLSRGASSPMQSGSMDALIVSSKNQEKLLNIVAKNTMNMNKMARDMSITSKNISKLVKLQSDSANLNKTNVGQDYEIDGALTSLGKSSAIARIATLTASVLASPLVLSSAAILGTVALAKKLRDDELASDPEKYKNVPSVRAENEGTTSGAAGEKNRQEALKTITKGTANDIVKRLIEDKMFGKQAESFIKEFSPQANLEYVLSVCD